MGLLDSLLSAFASKSDAAGGVGHPLGPALGSLLEQSGGMQGLMEKFQQGGLGDVFSSWVGTGENQGISAEQIQGVLGSGHLQAVASKLGLDASQVSGFLAEYLPKIVDKLTPGGQVDGNANLSGGPASLPPSPLSGPGGGGKGAA